MEKHKELASLEGQVYRFVELLSEQRAATRENIQRKQAQTGKYKILIMLVDGAAEEELTNRH